MKSEAVNSNCSQLSPSASENMIHKGTPVSSCGVQVTVKCLCSPDAKEESTDVSDNDSLNDTEECGLSIVPGKCDNKDKENLKQVR